MVNATCCPLGEIAGAPTRFRLITSSIDGGFGTCAAVTTDSSTNARAEAPREEKRAERMGHIQTGWPAVGKGGGPRVYSGGPQGDPDAQGDFDTGRSGVRGCAGCAR